MLSTNSSHIIGCLRKLEGVCSSYSITISLRPFGSDPKTNLCWFDQMRTISNCCCNRQFEQVVSELDRLGPRWLKFGRARNVSMRWLHLSVPDVIWFESEVCWIQTHPTLGVWRKMKGVYNFFPISISLRPFGSELKTNLWRGRQYQTVVVVDHPKTKLVNLLERSNYIA